MTCWSTGTACPLAFNPVDERYFVSVGIRLRSGRGFRPDEAANEAHVAVISAATASMLWPQGNPLDQRLRLAANPDDPAWKARDVEVIGIVDDAGKPCAPER